VPTKIGQIAQFFLYLIQKKKKKKINNRKKGGQTGQDYFLYPQKINFIATFLSFFAFFVNFGNICAHKK